jgi:hypothetical protein
VEGMSVRVDALKSEIKRDRPAKERAERDRNSSYDPPAAK